MRVKTNKNDWLGCLDLQCQAARKKHCQNQRTRSDVSFRKFLSLLVHLPQMHQDKALFASVDPAKVLIYEIRVSGLEWEPQATWQIYTECKEIVCISLGDHTGTTLQNKFLNAKNMPLNP